jgi:sigma-B regulation protein RsbU (phosphoserine phosphatase)
MTSQKDTISKRTLVFRYAALSILTAYLTTMVATSFLLLHREVQSSNTYRGWWMGNLGGSASFYDFGRIRRAGGVIVASVDPVSPAEKAGLEVGDTIIAVNGVTLTEHPQAYFRFNLTADAGDSAFFTVRRGNAIKIKTFVIVDRDSAFSKMGYLGVVSRLMNRDSLKARKLSTESGILIEEVNPSSPAEVTGLKAGDILTTFDGVRIESDTQFTRLVLMIPPAKNVKLELIRDGTSTTLVATLSSKPSNLGIQIWFYGSILGGSPAKVVWMYYFPRIILPLLLLIVGALVGWMRPRDSVAFDSALLFLCFGSTMALNDIPGTGSLQDWFLVILVSGSNLLAGMIFPLSFRLLSVFPVPTKLGKMFLRWQGVAFVIFGLYGIRWFVAEISILFGWKDPIPFNLSENWPLIILCLGMIVLMVAQRRASRNQPQARLRLFEFSVFLGAVAGLIFTFRDSFLDITPEWLKPAYGYVMWWLPVLLWAVFPIAFGYTVLTKKVFDIRFIIRKGLRYILLSRGALVIEGIIVFLIVFQVITHGGENIAGSPFAVSSLSVGSTLAVIFVLGKVNRKLMPVIDRRFFREALDVRKLLMDLNEQLSELREQDKILQLTASTVLKTLHPLRVVFLLKDEKAKDFKCVLVQEYEAKQPPSSDVILIPTEGREKNLIMVGDSSSRPEEIGTRLRVTNGLSANDPIIRQLEEKRSFVTLYPEKLNPALEEDKRLLDLDCELLIAIQGSAGLVGIMALGGKLSEEPYSKEDRDLLTTVARQMGLSLENAELLEIAKREAEQSRDLEIARSVQQNLFPKQLPVVAGWEFAGICNPAKAVGGDYYDIFEAVPGKVVVALGDVSGKGLGASFVMSGVHSTIRTNAEKSIDNPVGLINELNKYLLESTSKNIFVTLFLAIIDLETGLMRYVNCGHPPAFVVRKESGEIEKLTRTGLALGMMNTIQFTQGSSTLKAGDSLIVYSDGITEAMNEKEEMYEEERLSQLLSNATGLEASTIMEKILNSVETFASGAEQADDISVIVVSRK